MGENMKAAEGKRQTERRIRTRNYNENYTKGGKSESEMNFGRKNTEFSTTEREMNIGRDSIENDTKEVDQLKEADEEEEEEDPEDDPDVQNIRWF